MNLLYLVRKHVRVALKTRGPRKLIYNILTLIYTDTKYT